MRRTWNWWWTYNMIVNEGTVRQLGWKYSCKKERKHRGLSQSSNIRTTHISLWTSIICIIHIFSGHYSTQRLIVCRSAQIGRHYMQPRQWPWGAKSDRIVLLFKLKILERMKGTRMQLECSSHLSRHGISVNGLFKQTQCIRWIGSSTHLYNVRTSSFYYITITADIMNEVFMETGQDTWPSYTCSSFVSHSLRSSSLIRAHLVYTFVLKGTRGVFFCWNQMFIAHKLRIKIHVHRQQAYEEASNERAIETNVISISIAIERQYSLQAITQTPHQQYDPTPAIDQIPHSCRLVELLYESTCNGTTTGLIRKFNSS